MPQWQQDELYDFYTLYGSTDADGKITGIFRRARSIADDGALDVNFADFAAGNLSPSVLARAQTYNDGATTSATHVDAMMERDW